LSNRWSIERQVSTCEANGYEVADYPQAGGELDTPMTENGVNNRAQ
jgi:hypothetical protein